MKWLGILCILLGSGGFGFLAAGELEARVRMLVELQEALQLLKGELRCARQDLTGSFRNVSAHVGEPYSEFFRQTGEALMRRDGASAGEVWKRSMERYLSPLPMQRQEYQALERLGGVLGYLDMEAQQEALESALRSLSLAERDARQKSESGKKLYRALGMLCGLFLAVLLA